MVFLRNNKVKASFACDSTSVYVKRVENFLSGEAVEFVNGAFALVIGENGGRILYCKDMTFNGITLLQDKELLCEFYSQEFQMRVEYRCTLNDFVISAKLIVHNSGAQDIYIKDVIMFSGKVQTDTVLKGQEHNVLYDGMNNIPSSGSMDAQPVFIGGHVFLGIDWPVSQNTIFSNQILCRQFSAKSIRPGDFFESKPFSIGVGEKNHVSEAFLAHINSLRGRETRRASFYFDWLTHASEGLTEENMEKVLNFMQMLKTEYGIHFDIFAVDDGIVETRWGTTFDLYRLQHDSLYPSGLKRLTDMAGEMNMAFGVWLGPDGFGDTEQAFRSRVDTVVNMIKEWNIDLIKLDVCVSPLLGSDPYSNEEKMEKLNELIKKCRRANPDLIVINHRVSLSPYILSILDSTLWEGVEGYPEIMLYNSTKPRLFTRHASYGRGKPVYYGAYSQLLEDHGVCLNGLHEGWREELVVQAFGRALMLSPEIYGALFLLPDSEYPELGRLMKHADEKRNILANTRYIEETGDFIHTNGNQSIICMINDSWEVVNRQITIGHDIGIESQNEEFAIIRHYPLPENENIWRAKKDESIQVMLGPLSVCLIEVLPFDPFYYKGYIPSAGKVMTHRADRMDKAIVNLGQFSESQCSPTDIQYAEKARFTISSNPIEYQQIRRLAQSKHEEVNECRRFLFDKLRYECCGIAENAWDNDPATAWGDAPWYRKTANIWRLDLEGHYKVEKIEVKLSHMWNGPVPESEKGRKLEEPILFEASGDGLAWFKSKANVYYVRNAFMDGEFPDKLIAEFINLPEPVRYIRFHFRGVLVQGIKILERRNGQLINIDSREWHGNNLFTARRPLLVYANSFYVDEVWEGRYLAYIIRFPDNTGIPARRENAVAWVESEDGAIWYITEASPIFPFHPWESQGDDFIANAFTFRLALTNEMAGKRLTAKLAWFGPESSENEWNCRPEITGCLIAVR